ncbi:hypothetical protein BDZ97DRAFT_353913 [Flammula alnicola]|nr:hypothetical protein BDZ97DRAFT_353913 [Flammula alnicola]
MDSPEGLRLRLMTLLSLYDLLPYSISNPPHGSAPLTLEEAIGPEAVRRCLDAISRQQPHLLPGELSNILRGSRNTNTAGQSTQRTHGHGNGGNNMTSYYSSYPTSSSQSSHLRGSYKSS